MISSEEALSQFPTQRLVGDITELKPLVDNKPKGRNVSGRTWKVRAQPRASSLVTSISLNRVSKGWEKKQAEKAQLKAVQELEKELKDATKKAIIEKKERRLEQEKRRAENEFKNAQNLAQTLNHKNMHLKLKAMNKKQLRQIKKTRMNVKTGAVEFVPAYAK